MTRLVRRPAIVIALFAVLTASCGGGDGARETGIRMLSTADSAALLEDPPADLTILDVRTLDEFNEGHLAGAERIDFSRADFATQLASLERDTPYLIYCRSGNRSGQARAIMEDLGFSDVADLDGGVLAWADAGYELVMP